MKQRLIHIALLSLPILAGCTRGPSEKPGNGKDPDVSNPTQATQWIDKYLRQWYLWPDVLTGKMRDYDLEYGEFFESLLTRNAEDGKWSGGEGHFYSYIEREEVDAPTKATRTGPEGELNVGFRFVPVEWTDQYGDKSLVLIITHVAPGSDACLRGLLRGDEIKAVNGATISYDNYVDMAEMLYMPRSASGIALEVTRYRALSPYEIHFDITPAIRVESPVLNHAKVDIGDKTIGYLAYAFFESGYPDSEDFRFNDELKAVFREFAAEPRVDEVVIDLRYNTGGSVDCCRLLASMLVPAAQNQAVFSKNEFNDYIKKTYLGGQLEQVRFLTVPQMSDAARYGQAPGVNLDMKKVYVLVNRNSASASELLVNSLRGVGVQVVLLGERTYGKGVGMSRIDYQAPGVAEEGVYKDGAKYYRYTMWPVTFISYNAADKRISTSGFSVTYSVNEYASKYFGYGWNSLGDPQEALFAAAIEHITTGRITRATRAEGDAGARTAAPRMTRQAGMKYVPVFLSK